MEEKGEGGEVSLAPVDLPSYKEEMREGKKNIGQIRGVKKYLKRNSCGPDSHPYTRNSPLSRKIWNYGKKIGKY